LGGKPRQGSLAGVLDKRLRTFALPVVLLALAAGFAQRAAAEPATAPLYWSSPVAVDPGHGFYGISCPSVSLCVAADYAGNIVTSTHPATEVSAWSLAHIESLELATVGSPRAGVSCVSSPLCVVVVRGEIATSTNPTGGTSAWKLATPSYGLSAVSCASSTLCVAVGEKGRVLAATDPTGGSGAWTASQVDGENNIDGVACSPPTLCVAVDANGDILTSTNPTGGAGAWAVSQLSTSALSGVACVGSELCFVGGAYGSKSFVSSDPASAPSSWAITEGVDASGGVSCAATTLCVAAGSDTNAGLSDSANPIGGTGSWYQDELGNVGDRIVDGVSCPSVSLCLAVDGEGNVFLAAPANRLSVSLLGPGTGGVTSTPVSCPFSSCSHPGPRVIEPQPISQIQCSDSDSYLIPDNGCALGFPVGSDVTLTATSSSGSAFDGWSGACTGEGTCTVGMGSEQLVDATFGIAQPPPKLARISSLRESHSMFAVAGSSTPLTAQASRRRPHGTIFSFLLSQAATVQLRITTTRPGRRSGESCRPESRALRRKPRCTRTVTIATLLRTADVGTNAIAFTGRIRHRALRPGRYKATLTATDQAGISAPKAIGFTILAP
jgi:hypothetical protein